MLRHGRSGKHRAATFPLAQKPPRSDTRETDVTAINFVSQQQERKKTVLLLGCKKIRFFHISRKVSDRGRLDHDIKVGNFAEKWTKKQFI